MVSADTFVQSTRRHASGVMHAANDAQWRPTLDDPAIQMMDASLITLGAQSPDAALTLNRVALGTFFAISGYLKLFDASRHATLIRTLQDDGVRAVPIMKWLAVVMLAGPGPWSVDALIATRLAT